MVNQYPIILRFDAHTVAPAGFAALVVIEGRALAVEADGQFWMDGVNPGGLTASGSTLHEAAQAFRVTVDLVIRDIAETAADFITFRQDVEQFFYEVDSQTANAWMQAREGVKAGSVKVDGLLSEPAPEPSIIVLEARRRPTPTVVLEASKRPALAA